MNLTLGAMAARTFRSVADLFSDAGQIDLAAPTTRRPSVKVDPYARRHLVEALESRTLLVGDIPAPVQFNFSPSVFGTGNGIPSGFVTTGVGSVRNDAAGGSPESLLFPTGTIDIYWYGGSAVASLAVVPGPDPGNPFVLRASTITQTQITLRKADAGPALSAGPLAGRHLLSFSYSGDANFAGLQFDDAGNFAKAEAGTFYPQYLVAFSDENLDETYHIAYLQSADDAAVDDVFDPPVTIQIFNQDGAPALNTSRYISLELSGGDGAILNGQTGQQTVNGVATFDDLSIDKPGRYQLIATGVEGQEPLYSGTFDVTESKLKFIKEPKTGDAGSKLNPAIVVALQDGKGKTITTDSTTVVTLSPVGFDDGPITGNTATLVNGIATFDNLILEKPGFYQLQASSDNDDAVATTKKFKVGGLHLDVTKEPGAVNVNDGIPFTVAIKNAKNKVVTDANSIVQVTLNRLTPGSIAELEGTTTLSFVGGVATFPLDGGLSIDQPGKYSLTITEVEVELSSGVLIPTNTTAPVDTKTFDVGNYHLVFRKPPAATQGIKNKLDFAVAQVDKKNKVNAKLNSHHVLLTLNPVKEGESGKLSTYTEVGFVNGVQTFNGDLAPSINRPGTYTLTATEVDAEGVPVDTTTPGTSKPFKVTGYQVVFLEQPKTADVNRAIPFKIAIVDAKKRIVIEDDPAIRVLVTNTLTGTAPTSYGFTAGEIDFPDRFEDVIPITIDTVGSTKLTITLVDNFDQIDPDSAYIAGATSRGFKVAKAKLAFREPPRNSTVGGPIPMEIVYLSSKGKVEEDENLQFLKLTLAGPTQELLYTRFRFSNGVVEYIDKYPPSPTGPEPLAAVILTPGKYTLTASVVGLDEEVTAVTSRPFTVSPQRLVFLTQPTGATVGTPLPAFQIGLTDVNGRAIPDDEDGLRYSAIVRISLRAARGGPNAPATELAVVNMSGDPATFSGLTINTPGKYVLIATDISEAVDLRLPADPVTSSVFTII